MQSDKSGGYIESSPGATALNETQSANTVAEQQNCALNIGIYFFLTN